jgi:phosphoribosylformylglycinamidine cyclo-ligase
MARVFNCGIGMTVHVAAGDAARAIAILADAGQAAAVIGRIESGSRGVVIA